jgi:hypothetical protein
LRSGLVAAGVAWSAVTAAALLVDPPAGGLLAPDLDRLSVIWLGLAVGSGLAGWASAGLPRRTALLIVAALAASWSAGFFDVVHHTVWATSLEQAAVNFGMVVEMRRISHWRDAVTCLANGVAATALLGWLSWRRRDPLLGYAALCGVLLIGCGWLHVRFSTYPSTLGAVMLPPALTLAGRALRGAAGGALAARAALAAAVLLLPWLAVRPAEAATAAKGACRLSAAAPMLAPYAGKVVLADPVDSPELLYRTQALTVASFYHRGGAALVRLMAAWNSPSWDEPGAALDATGATLVLACRDQALRHGVPGSLMARLAASEIPPWLRRIGAEPSGYVLYERTR